MSSEKYSYGQDGEGWFVVTGPSYPEKCYFPVKTQAREMAEFLNKITPDRGIVRALEILSAYAEGSMSPEIESASRRVKEYLSPSATENLGG
jgi:maleate cis-trans isomerase